MARDAGSKKPVVRSKRQGGKGRPFAPGTCPNPGGKTKEQRAAEDCLRDLATRHGMEPDAGGVPRAVAVLGKLAELALDGNVPAATAYLDRVGLKPVDRVAGADGNPLRLILDLGLGSHGDGNGV